MNLRYLFSLALCLCTACDQPETVDPGPVGGKADWATFWDMTVEGAIDFGETFTLLSVGVAPPKPLNERSTCVYGPARRPPCVQEFGFCEGTFALDHCAEDGGSEYCCTRDRTRVEHTWITYRWAGYTFEATAGDVVSIAGETTSQGMDISLYRWDCGDEAQSWCSLKNCPIAGFTSSLWCNPDIPDSLDEVELPETGSYLITVKDPTPWPRDFDALYTLSLECLSGSCNEGS